MGRGVCSKCLKEAWIIVKDEICETCLFRSKNIPMLADIRPPNAVGLNMSDDNPETSNIPA